VASTSGAHNITNYIPVLQTAAAGTARFDHDPVTGESKGLLIEEQRTNLFTYSEDFSDSSWNKVGATVDSNVIISPDGTLTGDKLTETTSTAQHSVQGNSASISISTQYAVSVFAKSAGDNRKLAFLGMGLGTNFPIFNLDTGAVEGDTSNWDSVGIYSVGNGWYHCWAVGTAITAYAPIIALYDSTGDGYSGIYIWGAQVEAGAFPTSYIPTSGSQVTRSKDAASMTGTNFSDWYRQDEGTVYAEAIPKISGYSPIIEFDDGTQNNRILLEGGQDFHHYVVVNASAQVGIDVGATSANTQFALANAYKVNDFAASLNGGTVGTDSSGILPIVNRVRFGANAINTYSCTIKKLAYYPTRLTNAELQALTEA
jgi:hypothetical protein